MITLTYYVVSLSPAVTTILREVRAGYLNQARPPASTLVEAGACDVRGGAGGEPADGPSDLLGLTAPLHRDRPLDPLDPVRLAAAGVDLEDAGVIDQRGDGPDGGAE